MVVIHDITRNDQVDVTNETLSQYLNTNTPVVFTGLTKTWPAMNKWIDDKYILSTIGEHKVEVNMCTFGKMSDIFTMPFSEYWQLSTTGWPDLQPIATHQNTPYLRNFDIFGNFPQLGNDVLNEHLFDSNIHNMIVRGAFIGAKNTATHFHKDTGDNVVAVIRGSKFVVLVPPSEESNVVRSMVNIGGADGIPLAEHPSMERVGQAYATTLQAGEALFIPIGWVHYVHNQEFTVSVSCWGKQMI
ncbi:hypothetical protein SAMD00019534_120060, partial [Acytostelium subglobosum LB1]|uniref:hypothetical protein n=1 Tax=Acytostelium subglobosum LB1 TaxID=1410327 RepID=UPI000645181A